MCQMGSGGRSLGMVGGSVPGLFGGCGCGVEVVNRFQIVERFEERDCSGCGSRFVATDHRQRVCKKNCGRGARELHFVGVDGEGLGDDASVYVLFGVGDRHIENPKGLGWKECFEFLYGEFERHGKGVAFVGFFLGYDFTQILKSLPEDRARMLLTIEGKAKRAHRVKGKEPHPVECEGWQFDLLGSKRLRIRPKLCRCRFATCKCKKAAWCFLCDVGGFFQTSFLNVINPDGWADGAVCSREEYEKISEGKTRRSSAELDEDMREYMHLEIKVLERVMSVLANGLNSIGISLSPRQWFGPGQAASKWLKGKVKPSKELMEVVPGWFNEAARFSYYGGWFETMMHGHIRGEVHEYDINSAYPSIIATLPCLEHGKYTRGRGRPIDPPTYCLVKARVTAHGKTGSSHLRAAQSAHIGTMPHRNPDGSICRPDITEGWYWLDELETARSAGFIGSVDWKEWVGYEACSCPPPFKDIVGLYEKRLEFGKNSPIGKSSKLVYNSCYGKFAQSIGSPQFGNAIYASLITRGCRRTILDAIGSHPMGARAVAMVATDAVFFTSKHPGLEISNRLGEWDYTLRKNLTIFKPGVYWDDETRKQIREGKKAKFKARGINAEQFSKQIWLVDSWYDSWHDTDTGSVSWPDVKFESGFTMVSCLQALVRGKWTTAGQISSVSLLQSSNPYRKRTGIEWDGDMQVWRSGVLVREYDWETMDWKGVISKPYIKMFGLEDPFSDESKEEYGITEDGYVSHSYKSLFNNEE